MLFFNHNFNFLFNYIFFFVVDSRTCQKQMQENWPDVRVNFKLYVWKNLIPLLLYNLCFLYTVRIITC